MGQPDRRPPNLVTIQRRALFCVICRGQLFFDRDVMIHSTGFVARQWSLWLSCASCGYVHQFVDAGPAVELWFADRGYPAGALGDSDDPVDTIRSSGAAQPAGGYTQHDERRHHSAG